MKIMDKIKNDMEWKVEKSLHIEQKKQKQKNIVNFVITE